MKQKPEIDFRQLDEPVASWSQPGLRWVVEYWCYAMAYPIAQAWVYIVDEFKHVELLHVMENYRRDGVGTALLKAIIKRWPDVEYNAHTNLGEQFLDGFSRKNRSGDCVN